MPIALLVALLIVAMVTPWALSYLSGWQQQGISIRATPIDQVWEISGTFDECRWKTTHNTGIYITNKCRKDIWVYTQYSEKLKQVFKHSDPILVPSGKKVEISLLPLDEKDSLRLPNPGALIDRPALVFKDKSKCLPVKCMDINWKQFKGNITFITLNHYGTLDSGEVKVSGKTLWELFFAPRCQTTAEKFYQNCWENGEFEIQQKYQTKATPGDIMTRVKAVIEEASDYQPMEIMLPVMQLVEEIAPGLLEERNLLLFQSNEMADELKALSDMAVKLENDKFLLEAEKKNQQDMINNLNVQIMDLSNKNQGLLQEIKNLSFSSFQLPFGNTLKKQTTESTVSPAALSGSGAGATSTGGESSSAVPTGEAPAAPTATGVDPTAPADSSSAPVDSSAAPVGEGN